MYVLFMSLKAENKNKHQTFPRLPTFDLHVLKVQSAAVVSLSTLSG